MKTGKDDDSVTYAASSILKRIKDTKQTDINDRYCLSNRIVMNLSLPDITGSRFDANICYFVTELWCKCLESEKPQTTRRSEMAGRSRQEQKHEQK